MIYLLAVALISTTLWIKAEMDKRDYRKTITVLEDSVESWQENYSEASDQWTKAQGEIKALQLELSASEKELQREKDKYNALTSSIDKVPFAEETKQCSKCGATMMKRKTRWVCTCGSWEKIQNVV